MGEEDGDEVVVAVVVVGIPPEDASALNNAAAASLSLLSTCIIIELLLVLLLALLLERLTEDLLRLLDVDLRFLPPLPLALVLPLLSWGPPPPVVVVLLPSFFSTVRFNVEFHRFLIALSVLPSKHLLISAHLLPNLA